MNQTFCLQGFLEERGITLPKSLVNFLFGLASVPWSEYTAPTWNYEPTIDGRKAVDSRAAQKPRHWIVMRIWIGHLPIWSNSSTSILTLSCSKRFLILVQKGQVVLEKTMTVLAATSWSTVSMGEEVMGAMVAKLLSCNRGLRTGKLAAERSGTKTSYHSFWGEDRLELFSAYSVIRMDNWAIL